MLMPGTYLVDLWLGDSGGDFDIIDEALSFEVLPTDMYGTGRLPPSNLGHMFCPATFAITTDNDRGARARDDTSPTSDKKTCDKQSPARSSKSQIR